MNENNYGFQFNNITVNENIFNKKSKNKLGEEKINNEISFYLYIINNKIYFPMPKMISYKNGNLTLEYIKNSSTLTNKINTNNIDEYVNKIIYHLNYLHNIKQYVLFDDLIKRDIIIECEKKILNRFNEFDWQSNILYNSIKYVNNIKINDINYYCNTIKNKIIFYLKERNYYNFIHGDTHLGNILIDNSDNLFFIDPRGYFGESKFFGLKEYDYAKLMFGISGYSIFDNMIIDELEIKNNNIEINFIRDYEYIFEKKIFDNVTVLLSLSIWLGNNSCFSNINKKITSLMIACYYCEKYLGMF